MITTLKKHGNSRALVISREMMEQLGITEDTPLEVTVHDGTLRVTPTEVGIGQERVEQSIQKLRKRYAGMLRRLAE
ncbi:MAG: AbrB/MazE/SpoVT family DNA-binding domain-containing protein [Phycisphaeraceae bacterium]